MRRHLAVIGIVTAGAVVPLVAALSAGGARADQPTERASSASVAVAETMAELAPHFAALRRPARAEDELPSRPKALIGRARLADFGLDPSSARLAGDDTHTIYLVSGKGTVCTIVLESPTPDTPYGGGCTTSVAASEGFGGWTLLGPERGYRVFFILPDGARDAKVHGAAGSRAVAVDGNVIDVVVSDPPMDVEWSGADGTRQVRSLGK